MPPGILHSQDDKQLAIMAGQSEYVTTKKQGGIHT